MNSPLDDAMLMDEALTEENRFHIMTSQEYPQPWTESSMKFKTAGMNTNTDNMSFQSFNWAPVEDDDQQYPVTSLGTTTESMSSFGNYASSEGISNPAFSPFQGNETYVDASQYMNQNPAPSSMQRYDNLRPPNHRSRPSRNSPNNQEESPTSMKSGLEVPKKPKLNRRVSDQSVTSMQSNANSTTNEKASTSTAASNEAHIIAERRYRNNLNAKITQIQNALQDARFRSHSGEAYRSRGGTYFNSEASILDADAVSPGSSGGKDRRRKADILDEAAEYIRFADQELRHLSEEVQWLSQALAAAQGRAYEPQHRHRG